MSENFLDTLKSIPNHVDGLVMACPTHPGAPGPVSQNRLPDAAPPIPGSKPCCDRFVKLIINRAAFTDRFVARTMMLVSCILEQDYNLPTPCDFACYPLRTEAVLF